MAFWPRPHARSRSRSPGSTAFERFRSLQERRSRQGRAPAAQAAAPRPRAVLLPARASGGAAEGPPRGPRPPAGAAARAGQPPIPEGVVQWVSDANGACFLLVCEFAPEMDALFQCGKTCARNLLGFGGKVKQHIAQLEGEWPEEAAGSHSLPVRLRDGPCEGLVAVGKSHKGENRERAASIALVITAVVLTELAGSAALPTFLREPFTKKERSWPDDLNRVIRAAHDRFVQSGCLHLALGHALPAAAGTDDGADGTDMVDGALEAEVAHAGVFGESQDLPKEETDDFVEAKEEDAAAADDGPGAEAAAEVEAEADAEVEALMAELLEREAQLRTEAARADRAERETQSAMGLRRQAQAALRQAQEAELRWAGEAREAGRTAEALRARQGQLQQEAAELEEGLRASEAKLAREAKLRRSAKAREHLLATELAEQQAEAEALQHEHAAERAEWDAERQALEEALRAQAEPEPARHVQGPRPGPSRLVRPTPPAAPAQAAPAGSAPRRPTMRGSVSFSGASAAYR